MDIKPVTAQIETDGHKLWGLDHLRALAITLVFFFHCRSFGHPEWEGQISGFGWTGVDLFFVLSGFLIAGQLFARIASGKPLLFKEYFLKRVFRIIPAYFTVVLLYELFPSLREFGLLAPVWRYLTFTLNIWLNHDVCNTFTHSWSLCVEEQFYLILPAIILLCAYFKTGKKAAYLILILFIAGFVIRVWSWNNLVVPKLSGDGGGTMWLQYIYYPTYTRLDGLLTGVFIAGLFTFYPAIKLRVDKYGNVLLIAGLVLLICSWFLCVNQMTFGASVFGFPLVSIGYGLIVAGAVCPSCVLYKFKSSFTTKLATLSYSIYLIHKIMLHTSQQIFGQWGVDKNGNLMFIIGIISSIAGALLLRYIVEKPFLRLRDKILLSWRRKKALQLVPTLDK